MQYEAMIILCSDNTAIQSRWQQALSHIATRHSVSTLADAEACLMHTPADILLLHLQLAELNGLAGLLALRQKYRDLRVIVFSDVPNDEEGLAVIKSGCVGYCNTYIHAELLHRVVETVTAGEVWVGQRVMQRLIQQLARPSDPMPQATQRLDSLTEREQQVAGLVAEGLSNKQIATQLDVTERTVKAHLSAIFQKTRTRDRLQLALHIRGTAQLDEKYPLSSS